jgi:hypothetical protein
MKRATLLALAMFILAGIAACSEGGRDAVRAGCGPEIEKLCAGDDRVGQCLRKHMDELSERCKGSLGKRK